MGIDLTSDGHTIVDFHQLSHWGDCREWENFNVSLSYATAGNKVVEFEEPCAYFSKGKIKASTLSLSVLVAIEMFNALNALRAAESLSCRSTIDCLPQSARFQV